jgi:hypothetical protein
MGWFAAASGALSFDPHFSVRQSSI